MGDCSYAPKQSGAPYPLIIFSHGFGLHKRAAENLMKHLASHGYIVAAMDRPLTSGVPPHGSSPCGPPSGFISRVKEAGDVKFLINTLLGFSDTAGDPFEGRVDRDRVGLMAFSGGGNVSLITAYDQNERDERVKAVMAMAPLSCMFQQGYFDTAVDVPLMLLHGDADLFNDLVLHSQALYAKANPLKSLVVMHGANHTGFTEEFKNFPSGGIDALGCIFYSSWFIGRIPSEVGRALWSEELGGEGNFVGVEDCRIPITGIGGSSLPGTCPDQTNCTVDSDCNEPPCMLFRVFCDPIPGECPDGASCQCVEPSSAASCTDETDCSDPTPSDPPFPCSPPGEMTPERQQEITEAIAAAFFGSVLQNDAEAKRYLADYLDHLNPDLKVHSEP